MTLYSASLPSPLGPLRLFVDDLGRLVRLDFPGATATAPPATEDAARCAGVAAQLDEYFGRRRREFALDLAAAGTPFQRAVWHELRAIPYGSTISYAELARRLGRPTAMRAVGAANGHNPIPIVVPCHRVIGADGSLTGFGGGLPSKRFLLELEGLHVDARGRVVPALEAMR
jgi:methylated-DNA-[protein]-cysteine S-methyltransferase